MVVPEGIAAEDAVFLPSMETALSIVHDAGGPTDPLWESTPHSPHADTPTEREIQASFWTTTGSPAGAYPSPPACVYVPDSAGGGRAGGSGGCGADRALGRFDPLA